MQYRVGTRQRRESLGDVRKVKLDDARKIARQRFAQVELGSDLAAERQPPPPRLTLGETAARYLDAKRDGDAGRGPTRPQHDISMVLLETTSTTTHLMTSSAPTWPHACKS